MENRKRIVTIGRQYGSGGGEVGKKLAEQLGVHCSFIWQTSGQETSFSTKSSALWFRNRERLPLARIWFLRITFSDSSLR